ncbi:MAG: hypothetical protein PHQ36_04375, partial [Anaerolineales bacterium]|nr:hypothetical protein [Anaerolineales bacterium]
MQNDPSASGEFDQLRALLLTQERERLESIEQKLKELNLRDDQLREILDELKRRHEDTEALITRITPSMSGMVRHTIRDSGGEMAEILGPIMGEAIRVQIRDSRDEMVDTLYPIIGATIQKALNQFTREFQRNIDARLRSTFGAEGMLRTIWARLRGVSGAELAMRDALAYEIREVFLIHRASGILIAHSHPGEFRAADSDLISGMLTAIRDFAKDAFRGEDELDEIQFGGDQVIIQNGAHAYLAMVVSGVEPEGLRAALSEFVSNLHVRFNSALRDFKGDDKDLPNLQPQLAQLSRELGRNEEKKTTSPQQKRFYIFAGAAAILTVAFICFYLLFTIKLLPVAFSQPTATALPPTATPTLTASPTPTFLPTATNTPLPTSTPVIIISGVSNGSIWVHEEPMQGSKTVNLLLKNTAVNIHALQGNWALVSWTDETGDHSGWVIATWIQPS